MSKYGSHRSQPRRLALRCGPDQLEGAPVGSQFNIQAKRLATQERAGRYAREPQSESATLYEVDVLVIGASLRGSQAACTAAAQGAQVLVLDKQAAAQLGLPHAHDKRAQAGSPAALAGARSVHWLARHHGLELLVDEQGRVCGAAGVSGPGERAWVAQAGAVILAGAETSLMAAEAGAQEDEVLPGLFLAQTAVDAVQLGHAAAALALQRALPRPELVEVEAALHRLRATGRAGLRGSGRYPINPFALQQALHAVTSDLGASQASGELERLDALWQMLLASAPAARGALSACRTVAERLALARWQAQRCRQQQERRQAELASLPHEFDCARLHLRLQAFAR